jgi:hypothetical protein
VASGGEATVCEIHQTDGDFFAFAFISSVISCLEKNFHQLRHAIIKCLKKFNGKTQDTSNST